MPEDYQPVSHLHRTLKFIEDIGREWNGDNVPRLSASLAYYTIFSLAPLLVIAISVAGLVFGKDAAEGRLVHELDGLVGPASAAAIQHLIQNAWRPKSGWLAGGIGVVTLFLGASGVLNELKGALNVIWKAAPSSTGLRYQVLKQVVSLAFLLGIGFLLLVSLLASVLISAMGEYLRALLPLPPTVLEAANFFFSFGLVVLLFAMILKGLPDNHVDWEDTWLGAAITAIFFSLGKFALGRYIGHNAVVSSYGAAGSVIVVLLWVYYSALILYTGAEFTKVQAGRRRHGA